MVFDLLPFTLNIFFMKKFHFCDQDPGPHCFGPPDPETSWHKTGFKSALIVTLPICLLSRRKTCTCLALTSVESNDRSTLNKLVETVSLQFPSEGMKGQFSSAGTDLWPCCSGVQNWQSNSGYFSFFGLIRRSASCPL
jgi:hypothetical protein